ncbi:hypothetical protein Gorai_006117, partial [Gossypium raimondii]|nr:hypothetical protein [Gossypium raimondii]
MARVWVSSLETQMVVLSGKTPFTNKVFNFKWAELDALIKCFWLAQLLNVDKIIFETDCATVANCFNHHKEDITIL